MSKQRNANYNFYAVLSLSFSSNEQELLQIFVIIFASIIVGGLGLLMRKYLRILLSGVFITKFKELFSIPTVYNLKHSAYCGTAAKCNTTEI